MNEDYFVIYGESNIDALKRISSYPCECDRYTWHCCRRCMAKRTLDDMMENAANMMVKIREYVR